MARNTQVQFTVNYAEGHTGYQKKKKESTKQQGEAMFVVTANALLQ